MAAKSTSHEAMFPETCLAKRLEKDPLTKLRETFNRETHCGPFLTNIQI